MADTPVDGSEQQKEIRALARELVKYMKERSYAPSIACAALLEVHLTILKARRPHETIEEAAVELIETLKRDVLRTRIGKRP